jgi:hypothetical protein
VPTYPRHPAALAQQARTVALATSGRLTLGIGLSHKVVIEDMFGYDFDRPVRHMDEYLSALLPLLAGEPAGFTGETLRAHLSLSVPNEARVPLVMAALGPRKSTHVEPGSVDDHMVGECLGMAGDEFLVATRCIGKPSLGFPGPAGIVERPGKHVRVLGVVAGHRENVQTLDGGIRGTQGSVDLGEVGNRRGVGRHSAYGGGEPGTGRGEVTLAEPHQATPVVELGDRNEETPR